MQFLSRPPSSYFQLLNGKQLNSKSCSRDVSNALLPRGMTEKNPKHDFKVPSGLVYEIRGTKAQQGCSSVHFNCSKSFHEKNKTHPNQTIKQQNKIKPQTNYKHTVCNVSKYKQGTIYLLHRLTCQKLSESTKSDLQHSAFAVEPGIPAFCFNISIR